MALLHRADLTPTKLELLATWLPGRDWYRGPAGVAPERVAACRFDDPAGAVGIETILVRAGDGPIHHIPLTYRGAPLEGGAAWLVGTCEHSVLGRRWVYDACADPVYAAAAARAIVAGTGEAEEFVEADGGLVPREPAMTLTGSGVDGVEPPAAAAVRQVVDGDPTLVVTDAGDLTVFRVVGDADGRPAATLTGSWPGRTAPVLLASLRKR